MAASSYVPSNSRAAGSSALSQHTHLPTTGARKNRVLARPPCGRPREAARARAGRAILPQPDSRKTRLQGLTSNFLLRGVTIAALNQDWP